MDIFSFIKSQCNIAQVVGDYTTLKKIGHYWKGCCPFHSERTASFTVTPHKEIFYCFGCHKGGDVIAFIAEMEHCTQLEAARHLAERYGITIPVEISSEKGEVSHEQKKRYLSLYDLVAQWLRQELAATPAPQQYLRQRNITAASTAAFEIGYFPTGQAALKRLCTFLQPHGFMVKDLLAAHIILEGKKILYSPFEERIIFPIKDHLGRICGFGGRIFKTEDNRAKYYNSHDHSFFSKSSLLFGLDTAKKEIQKENRVFLVEGYTDCVAMAQAGYKNTVATLGTACTAEHLKLLSRYTSQIWVMYDGDAAGKNALLRLSELCWEANLDVMVLELPENDDPASYLTTHKNLDDIITTSKDTISFFINQASKSFSSQGLHAKLSAIKELVQMIGRCTDNLKQDILLQKLAASCQLPLETVKQELLHQKKQRSALPEKSKESAHTQQQPFPTTIKNSQKEITLLDQQMFSAILSYDGQIESDDKAFLYATLPSPLAALVQRFDNLPAVHGKRDFSTFFTTLAADEKDTVGALLITNEGESSVEAFQTLLSQYQKKQWKKLVQDVTEQLATAQKTHDTDTIQKLIKEFQDFKKKMAQKGLV